MSNPNQINGLIAEEKGAVPAQQPIDLEVIEAVFATPHDERWASISARMSPFARKAMQQAKLIRQVDGNKAADRFLEGISATEELHRIDNNELTADQVA